MSSSAVEHRWLVAPNLSADATGSIHDDAQAKELGFKGALIGGSVTTSFMTPALVEQFGQAWYERGFLKQSFIAPLYEQEEFRVVFDELPSAKGDECLFSLALEKRSGEQHTAGYAGLARSADGAAAPWERPGEPAASEDFDEDPLPGQDVGAVFPPIERTVSASDPESLRRRRTTGDESPWYGERSPWGGPIVPTFMYTLMGLRLAAPPSAGAATSSAGMNGTFQLLLTGPMLCDEPYTLQGRLAEKGWGRRSAFRTVEFAVTGADGRRVAVVRQKVRWLAQPPAGGN
jgi:hypothetical protein